MAHLDPQDYAPTWQPNRQDVCFDHEAVAATVKALQAADQAVKAAADQRVKYAEQASITTLRAPGFVGPVQATPGGILAGWQGPHRVRWEIGYRASLVEATAHRQHIAGLITSLGRAATAASAEQTRREAERRRWEDEYDEGMKQMRADEKARRQPQR